MSDDKKFEEEEEEEKNIPEEPDWENNGLTFSTLPVIPKEKIDYQFYIESYDFDEIIPGFLLLGEYEASLTEKVVKKVQIIMNITPDKQTVKFPWITYHQYDIEDDEDVDIYHILPETTKILQEAYSKKPRVPTLVHCLVGISRSSTVVIAFIMKQFGWTFEKALKFVQSKRDCVGPNSGFIEQLKKWGKEEVVLKPSKSENQKNE